MELGKRSRLTPTRSGMIREVFYVCYNCPAELSEIQAPSHNCTTDQKEGKE
jgi:hypothetical protein